MNTCSLIVPTFRNNHYVRANLAYLSQLSHHNLKVIIADNSTLPEKHEYLRKIIGNSNHTEVYLHSENIGALQNYAFLLDKTANDDFIVACADDDHISLDFIEYGVALLSEHPSLVAAAGRLIGLHSNGGIFTDPMIALEETAPQRVASSFNPSSFNLILYSVIRRKVLSSWLSYTRNHPFPGAFFDFLWSSSALIAGKIVRHPHGVYLWGGDNWDTPEANMATRIRYYQQQNLPQEFSLFFDLHFSIECANFITIAADLFPDNKERIQCANIIWERCIERYKTIFYSNKEYFINALGSNVIINIENIINTTTYHPQEAIDVFSKIIFNYSPELSEYYSSYHMTIKSV